MSEYNRLPVHAPYAFRGDEQRKARENRETYERLKEVCEFSKEPIEGKVCVTRCGHGYAHEDYRVVSNPINLDDAHIALFCDRGNLCFGYRSLGRKIEVFTD